MNSLHTLAAVMGEVLLGGFLAVVLAKLVLGGISLSGLLDGDVADPNSPDGSNVRSAPSAGRAQTLLATLFVALWYLLQVIYNPRQFPKLPSPMLGALAGSQALYLGGKLQAMLLVRPRNSSK